MARSAGLAGIAVADGAPPGGVAGRSAVPTGTLYCPRTLSSSYRGLPPWNAQTMGTFLRGAFG